MAGDSSVADYYRYFEVPDLQHCLFNGHPTTTFKALVDWVENGVEPDSMPSELKDASGKVNNRIVCPYPKKAVFLSECGDSSSSECFNCQ